MRDLAASELNQSLRALVSGFFLEISRRELSEFGIELLATLNVLIIKKLTTVGRQIRRRHFTVQLLAQYHL